MLDEEGIKEASARNINWIKSACWLKNWRQISSDTRSASTLFSRDPHAGCVGWKNLLFCLLGEWE